jgi:hypothetical protein
VVKDLQSLVDEHPHDDSLPDARPPPVIGQAETMGTRLVDWLFRSRRTGRITVAQFPNIALWLFIVTVVLDRVVSGGTTARTTIDWIGVVSLGWWALDEVLRGVNPWRRLLGLGVCALVTARVVTLAAL